MSELLKILENFCQMEGVKGALVVNGEKKVIESFLDPVINAEELAGIISTSNAVGQELSQVLEKQALSRGYIEFEEESITIEMLSKGIILAVLSSPEANLGRIRLEIRKNRKALENLVA